jgi:sugar lactone lactonase YvrE
VKKTLKTSSIAMAVAAMIGACAAIPQKSLPDKIAFAREGLYPEGIAYQDDANEFLVSSLRLGEIGTVTPDGRYRRVVNDPDLLSVVGIKYDSKRKNILACNSHPGATTVETTKSPGSVAQLMIYEAGSGERKAAHDLAALRPGVPHFCNDMAIDPAGNIYITDSFAPVIYRVGPDGTASIFLEDPAFASPDPGKAFALNGIVHHPDGYLLVNHMALGKLLKIDLDAKQISEVNLTEKIPGADGMVLVNSSTLAVVRNGLTGDEQEIVRLVSQDGWKNANETGSVKVGAVTPTTATMARSDIYVIDARLSEMFDDKGPRSTTFVIHEAKFE